MMGTNDDDDNADADDDDDDDGDDDHDDHDDVLNIYATQHVHVHWTVLCIPVNSSSWIHDLAQYRALERTQWKVQLMVQLLGYREIVSTEWETAQLSFTW